MAVDPLNGLRGLASLHVMAGHFVSSIWGCNLLHAVEMPLFFLLSGYCLTLRYSPAIDAKTFSVRDYLVNRFCRLAPIYWLVNAVLMLAENDYFDDAILEKNSPLNMLLTFSCTNTWFNNPWTPVYPAHPISLSSWTVNTLFFFYLAFPTLLKLLKPLSEKEISRWLVQLFWLQSLPPFLVWVYWDTSGRRAKDSIFYNLITQHPLLRLPVFAMGILGGLQTLRLKQKNSADLKNKDTKRGEDPHTDDDDVWQKKANQAGVLYLLFFLLCCSISSGSDQPRWMGEHSQLFVVYLQLYIILGLSRSKDESSIFMQICKSRAMQFVGDVSMILYLVHLDLVAYVKMYSSDEDSDEFSLPYRTATKTQILFCLIVGSLLLSWLLRQVFVNPLAKGIKMVYAAICKNSNFDNKVK